MTPKHVIAYARRQGYAGARPLGEWKGKPIYEPVYEPERVSYIGLPLFIIDDGGNCRMSTPEEAMRQVREYDGE